jgi:hypothetical protein
VFQDVFDPVISSIFDLSPRINDTRFQPRSATGEAASSSKKFYASSTAANPASFHRRFVSHDQDSEKTANIKSEEDIISYDITTQKTKRRP